MGGGTRAKIKCLKITNEFSRFPLRSLECVSAVNTRFSPAGIQREIRALHARTREREREKDRTIRRFHPDKAMNYSPLRALSSATNVQACAQPTEAGNTNS